jgi:hypothetical protein
MPLEPTDLDEKQSRLRPFQFSLKAALVLVTLICFWLGINTVQERRAFKMLVRRNAVYHTLVGNLSQPPPGTTVVYSASPFSQAQSLRNEGTIVSTGHSRSFNTDRVDLKLGPELSQKPAADIVHSIANHVGRDLQKGGISDMGGLTQSIGQAERYIGTWENDLDPAFTVIIEVVADRASKEAVVWAGVIENQSLMNWNLPRLSAAGWLLVLLFAWLAWLAICRAANLIQHAIKN